MRVPCIGKQASHLQPHFVQARLQRHLPTDAQSQPGRGRRRQIDDVRIEQAGAPLAWHTARLAIHGEQGLQPGRIERVQANHLEHFVAPGQLGVDLHRRAGNRHFRQACQLGVEAFVETGTCAAHRQIRPTRKRAHAQCEFIERGAIDCIHRHAQRYAEGDRKQRQQRRAAACA